MKSQACQEPQKLAFRGLGVEHSEVYRDFEDPALGLVAFVMFPLGSQGAGVPVGFWVQDGGKAAEGLLEAFCAKSSASDLRSPTEARHLKTCCALNLCP